MHIYFAPHATTTDNEAKLASGWRDVLLSELGQRQAKGMKETFSAIPIDLICCSDLKRATETVRLAFGDKIPVIVDRRLRELNYGDFNGKPSEIVEPMKVQHIKSPFPNGESYEQAMLRTQEFYKQLREEYADKTVLVVGHRATQYGLDTMVNGKRLEELLSVKFEWQPYWAYDF